MITVQKVLLSQIGAFIGALFLAMPVMSQGTPYNEAKALDPPDGKTSISKAPTKLFGVIEHSTERPAISPALRSGASFDVNRLKAITPNNHWFKIPSWIAGTWEVRNHNTYYERSFETGAEKFPVNDSHFAIGFGTWGFQKDKKGNIWEYQYADYLSVYKLTTGYDIHFVTVHEPLKVTSDRVVMMYRAQGIVTTGLKGTILRSQQTESIQTYTHVGGNVIRVDASIKVFDEQGKPTKLVKVLAYRRRRLPFASINNIDGRDLRNLFDEYLLNNGLHELRRVR